MLTDKHQQWWDVSNPKAEHAGLVHVTTYVAEGRPPEEVVMMEKAGEYGAKAVFFEGSRNSKPPVAQAFIFVDEGPEQDKEFAQLHKKLWSWGGVPLVYRKLPGQVQLFRCAHGSDFLSASGNLICNPIRTLQLATEIAGDPWWDRERLQNGTLWDDSKACDVLLSSRLSAHNGLIKAVKTLSDDLNRKDILPKHLRRKLLILSLLIAYLEERGAFTDGYLAGFLPGATKFFEVLSDGNALVTLLADLEERFNGHVFSLTSDDRELLTTSPDLPRFSTLIEGRTEANGQLTIWKKYSFRDLPVELISYIYQLFVKNAASSVYTPPVLVRLALDEVLSWERIDRLTERGEVILDPSCGSGVFLVEAYKRLVLHWRSRNQWKQPGVGTLKKLLTHIVGIDLEAGAIELAAFSLCLALCDALEPKIIRSTIRLFPLLAGRTLHHSCFFEAKELSLIKKPIGVIIGNPPFASDLETPGARRSYENYQRTHGRLPDRQVAYLFLHEAMEMMVETGVLCMLQQYNFLYNHKALGFRRDFISRWDVREILDFISVRGMFHTDTKLGADTKIVVVVVDANEPPRDRQILHATFRRSGRSTAEQGFDIDYYDLHWLPRELVLKNDAVWRANLFGGGRVLDFIDRLKTLRTLKSYAESRNWDCGEGFIKGKTTKREPAEHLTGKPYLPSKALLEDGPDFDQIHPLDATHFKSAYTSQRFTPPMLLVRAHMDLAHTAWNDSYLTYSQRIVGFCAKGHDYSEIQDLASWMLRFRRVLQAYVAASSKGLFIQKATAVHANDIFSIPYPELGELGLSANEEILVDDIVDFYRDLIRLGEKSKAMSVCSRDDVEEFKRVFTNQINAIYKNFPLEALETHSWHGFICQPFAFGKHKVDWSDSEALKGKLDALIYERQGDLQITRIAQIYDGNFIFFIKPDRRRFWMRSVALRDADETLADLREQGF